MSAASPPPSPHVVDYGHGPDRTRLRRRLIVLVVAVALLLGGAITAVQVRRELAQRAALLQAQQVAAERARLNAIFAGHQKELAKLEAEAAKREAEQAQRLARRRAATRAATGPALSN